MNSLIRSWLRATATNPVPWELPIKEEWIYRNKNRAETEFGSDRPESVYSLVEVIPETSGKGLAFIERRIRSISI